jgi:hypothetical protein
VNACYHAVQNPVFLPAIEKLKDKNKQNYNFTGCLVWVQNLVSHVVEKTQTVYDPSPYKISQASL